MDTNVLKSFAPVSCALPRILSAKAYLCLVLDRITVDPLPAAVWQCAIHHRQASVNWVYRFACCTGLSLHLTVDPLSATAWPRAIHPRQASMNWVYNSSRCTMLSWHLTANL